MTARRWKDLGVIPERAVNGELLLAAIQHHVEGIVGDALDMAGWTGRVSPHIIKALTRAKGLARTRHAVHAEALRSLAAGAPGLIESSLILKGGYLGRFYRDEGHRMLSDLDLVIESGSLGDARRVLLADGYWEKDGLNGPTFFKQIGPEWNGASHVTIDVHLDTPVKFSRPESTDAMWGLWSGRSGPWDVAGTACRTPDPALHLLNVIVHLAEDAVSWKSAIIENDLRLSRFLDVDVLLDQGGIEPGDLRALAAEIGVVGELAVGLAVYAAAWRALPPILEEAASGLILAGLDRILAVPGGRVVSWDAPAGDRLFGADRGARALALVEEPLRDRTAWFELRKGLIRDALDVPGAFVMATAASSGGSRPWEEGGS